MEVLLAVAIALSLYSAIMVRRPSRTVFHVKHMKGEELPQLLEDALEIWRLMSLDQEFAEFQDARLIEHDMYSWGGASGSPIFNSAKRVVAVHFAGLPVLESESGQFRKQQASIKQGIRVDALRDVLKEFKNKD